MDLGPSSKPESEFVAWQKKFMLIPVRTVTGKLAWGYVYRRPEARAWRMGYFSIYEYATKWEIAQRKLSGTDT